MSVEIRQLKDHNTDKPFVPITQWEAVGNKPTIPSKTSDLTNDSGFITIDDESASSATTYSSIKIETLISACTGGSSIDDSIESSATTWSSEKISGEFEEISYTTANHINEIEDAIESIPAWAKEATKPTYSVGEISGLTDELASKQDSFSIGENLELNDGYLSVLGYTYSASTKSISEGYNTSATGWASHAEGESTSTDKWASHVEGVGTIATNDIEHAQGSYNVSNNGTIHSVGIGYKDNDTQEEHRKNAVEVLWDGSVYINNIGNYDGTNPTGTGVQSLQEYINSLEARIEALENIISNQNK